MRPLILADHQEITKAGILYIRDKMPDLVHSTVYEAFDREELLRLLSANPNAIVVLDYTSFNLSGVDDLLILQARFKQTWWILFSEELSEDFIRRALFAADTSSMVLKDASANEIEEALRKAYRSERFLCKGVNNLLSHRKLNYEVAERQILTTTERDILKAIASGKTTKEIATERFSSIHTITTHRKNIFRKLEVNNAHEATRYALRAGIIDAVEYYI